MQPRSPNVAEQCSSVPVDRSLLHFYFRLLTFPSSPVAFRSAEIYSPCSRQKYDGLWLSLVERHVRDVEAVGSNPTSPITLVFNELREFTVESNNGGNTTAYGSPRRSTTIRWLDCLLGQGHGESKNDRRKNVAQSERVTHGLTNTDKG